MVKKLSKLKKIITEKEKDSNLATPVILPTLLSMNVKQRPLVSFAVLMVFQGSRSVWLVEHISIDSGRMCLLTDVLHGSVQIISWGSFFHPFLYTLQNIVHLLSKYPLTPH